MAQACPAMGSYNDQARVLLFRHLTDLVEWLANGDVCVDPYRRWDYPGDEFSHFGVGIGLDPDREFRLGQVEAEHQRRDRRG